MRAVKAAADRPGERARPTAVTSAARGLLGAQDTQVTEVTDTRSFLRSPKGILTMAALGVGVAYATFSKIHDRVHTQNPDR